MSRQRVEFPNAQGLRLSGILDHPDGPVRAWALFAHCFTCTKDSRAAAYISRSLAELGIGVLRFDFTGLGDSEGEFASSGLSVNIHDLVAAAQYLADNFAAPALLIGHSLGGAAVLSAAAEIVSSVAVVTIGAPARAAHVTRHFGRQVEEIRERGAAEVSIGGRPFQVSREFIEDLEQQPPPQHLKRLRRALLVMHSPIDAVVDIDNATEIFTQALHPKSFVSLDQADHLLTDRADAGWAGRVIAAWADRYLPSSASEAVAPEHEARVVATTAADGYRTPITAGRHHLLADEPSSVGGSDAGPSPYGLMSAALAACTSMTLQMYARRKGMALRTATVAVAHHKRHAADCEDCESRDGRIDQFDREIRLDGDLTEAERTRLMEIADRCPVHRTLHGEVRVRTRPAD
jgi:putative redox protein